MIESPYESSVSNCDRIPIDSRFRALSRLLECCQSIEAPDILEELPNLTDLEWVGMPEMKRKTRSPGLHM